MTRAAPVALEELLGQLTLEEKVRLVEGVDFWRTVGVERLGVPSLYLTDGPHGVRKVRRGDGAFGVADNAPATAFPPAVTVASTWDPENAERMGRAIAREARELGVDVLLAPGVNIKRNPLCGRNFEYYSEDPLVAGVFGAAFVRGVEGEGVATSVKHFAANSNEDYRFVGDSIVDERALREIYLRQFERIVREARPSTVMCAYNAVGGVFASDNRELLTGILREEWGFAGLVMTDWGATHDRVAAIRAGCDLDMPGDTPHNRAALIRAVRAGELPMEELDASVRRVLELALRERPAAGAPADHAAHAELACEIAVDGAVLLENDGTLPLAASEELVVVGELFERMRFQGAGSSLVTPTEVVTPRDAFEARGISYRYARGYRSLASERDGELEREAVEAARAGSVVLFFGGLSDVEESEGFDRTTMALGENQAALLEQLLDTGARVVFVLFAGAPVELPFAGRLAAILDMHLPGMHGGEATARVLFGEAEPAGRLAESWTSTASDASSSADFDRSAVARYAESIYVGYRCYDAAGTAPRYSFGHGLGYTSFAHRELAVRTVDDRVRVELTLENTGGRAGAEVVQLYVGNNRGAVFKAVKELRAFTKVRLEAGASTRVALEFALADLAYWDVAEHGWVLENGDYEVLVGASASDIRLRAPLAVTSGRASRSPYPPEVDADYATPPVGIPASFPALVGRPVPEEPRRHRLTLETRLVDARRTLIGRILLRAVLSRVEGTYRAALALPDGLERDARLTNTHFLVRMMPFQSMRSMTMASGGRFPHHVAVALEAFATGHPIRGIRSLVSGGRAARKATS